MSYVALFDLISVLGFLVTLVILIKGWHKPFLPHSKALFATLVLFSLVYSVTLFLEWSGITAALDLEEDLIGALLPMMWAFFLYAFLQNITNQDLLETTRKLNTLMTNLPGMAYRCLNDRDWSMVFVSQGCLDLTGFEPKDLLLNVKTSYGDLIHKDDQDMVWEQVQENVNKKQPFQLVYRIRTATGEEKWVWEQGGGIFSPTGDLIALEGFITDITVQKLAREALQKAHDELEEKVKERTAEITAAYQKLEKAYQEIKDNQKKIIQLEKHAIAVRITSTLAHETRNPVSAIGGSARMLKRKYAGDPNLAPLFDIILKETRKLEHLIAAVLNAGHEASAVFQELDPNQLMDDLVNLIKEKARLFGVTLRVEKQLFSINIIADKESVIVALKELVLNALEASPKGQDVVLRGNQEEKWVVFSVSDKGKGMDEETLVQIYDPLFSTKKLSSGLGLSFAKELIEAQHGYLRFDTIPGEGTTFYAYLPIA